MALNSLFCADVPAIKQLLTHSLNETGTLFLFSACLVSDGAGS